MGRNLRIRVWIETILAVVGMSLAVLTLAVPDWIEEIVGIEPDGGSGALEWIIVVAFLAIGTALGFLARRDQQRLRVLKATA